MHPVAPIPVTQESCEHLYLGWVLNSRICMQGVSLCLSYLPFLILHKFPKRNSFHFKRLWF